MPQDVFKFEVRCAECGKVAASLELVPPDVVPEAWKALDEEGRRLLAERRGLDWWHVLNGVVAWNGTGDPIDAARAQELIEALSSGANEALPTLGFYDDLGWCRDCRQAYCSTHWNVSIGAGRCPAGHFKSLDPHWHPDMDD